MGGLDGFDRFAASGGVVDAVDFGVVGVAFDRSEDERHDVVCLDVFESIDFGEHVLLRVVFDEADFSGFFPVDTVCGGDRFRGDGRGEASGADCRKAGHSECFVHTNSLVKVGKRCFPLTEPDSHSCRFRCIDCMLKSGSRYGGDEKTHYGDLH